MSDIKSTNLLGRESELGDLIRLFESCRDDAGKVVIVSGVSGVGKSSVVSAFASHDSVRNHLLPVIHCSKDHTSSPLFPIKGFFSTVVGLKDSNSEEMNAELLVRFLEKHHSLSDDAIALMSPLFQEPLPPPPETSIPLSNQRKRSEQLRLLSKIMFSLADEYGAVLVVEDLHWVDDSTSELLINMFDAVQNHKIMMLLTCWPDFVLNIETILFHFEHITISKLSESAAANVALSLSPSLDKTVLERIVTESNGMPLALRQAIKSIEADNLSASSSEPNTLADSVSRIYKTLSPHARYILQLISCLGSISTRRVLAYLEQNQQNLSQSLDALAQKEFIMTADSQSDVILFAHDALHELIYNSIEADEKAKFHALIAVILSKHFLHSVPDEIIASQFEKSGSNLDAFRFYSSAGDLAFEQYHMSEAMKLYQKAVSMIDPKLMSDDMLQQVISLKQKIGSARAISEGFNAVGAHQAYSDAFELCKSLPRSESLFYSLLGLETFYLTQAKYSKSLELAVQMVDLAEDINTKPILQGAYVSMGSNLFWSGQIKEAHKYLTNALSLGVGESALKSTSRDIFVAAQSHLAVTEIMLGNIDRGHLLIESALERAKSLNHLFTYAYVLNQISNVSYMTDDSTYGREYTLENIELSTRLGFPIWEHMSNASYGWMLSKEGEHEKGMQYIVDSIAALESAGAMIGLPIRYVWVARGYAISGKIDQALHYVEVASALYATMEDDVFKPEVLNAKAEILYMHGRHKEAEKILRQSIEISQASNNNLYQLKAQNNLFAFGYAKSSQIDILKATYGKIRDCRKSPISLKAEQLIAELS